MVFPQPQHGIYRCEHGWGNSCITSGDEITDNIWYLRNTPGGNKHWWWCFDITHLVEIRTCLHHVTKVTLVDKIDIEYFWSKADSHLMVYTDTKLRYRLDPIVY